MPSKLSGIMYNLIKDGYQNFVLSLFINNISILSSIKTKKINTLFRVWLFNATVTFILIENRNHRFGMHFLRALFT